MPALIAMLVLAGVANARAQGVGPSLPVGAGSEMERYLRVLSLTGVVSAPQWTVRRFTPREIDSLKVSRGPHPWSAWMSGLGSAASTVSPIAPEAGIVYNSSFPYGFNDGPVWAGRGGTLLAAGGITLRRGGLSVALNPSGFIAQNASVTLAPTGYDGGQRFSDWRNPVSIDQPQRFGDRSYGRIDPGESHARWDSRWFGAGVATDAETWGPATEHPIILGNNAGGFPRLFAGTPEPIDLKYVKVHSRFLWGRLDQSSYGWPTGEKRRHLATAAVGNLSIRGVPGLELGAIRFFHTAWPSGIGSVPWLQVFQGILKNSLGTASNPTGDQPDNQLASIFFRWAAPRHGFEVYGEYGREDHNADLRDLAKEPDHDAAYMLGFQRAWSTGDGHRISVLRAEVINARISHLQPVAAQTPWYVHGQVNQGHTYRGQVLGSAAAYGGGGSTLAWDRYSSGGRTTIRWDRLMQGEMRAPSGLPVSDRADVVHAIAVERTRFKGRMEITNTAAFMKEFNRHFGADAYNFNVSALLRLVR